MTECDVCGIDLDIEGRFTCDDGKTERCYQFCGYCRDKVKEFIERDILRV
jgi:hypothetical protein